MSNQDMLRKEIASLIRDNEDELIDLTIQSFFETFSIEDFPDLPLEKRRSWTKQELDGFIYALETNDTSKQSYVSFYGFIIPSMASAVYSIGNFIESRLLFARVILPYIVSSSLFDLDRSRDLVNCFEELVLRIIRENIQRYADDEFAPGSLTKYASALFPRPQSPAVSIASGGNGTSGLSASNGKGDFTTRELEVLEFVAAGKTNKEIAAACGISTLTAKNHISHILAKLHLENRTELAIWALHNL